MSLTSKIAFTIASQFTKPLTSHDVEIIDKACELYALFQSDVVADVLSSKTKAPQFPRAADQEPIYNN